MSRSKTLTVTQMATVAAALDIAAEKYLMTAEQLKEVEASFPGKSIAGMIEEFQSNAADALELAADFRAAAPVILSLPNDTIDATLGWTEVADDDLEHCGASIAQTDRPGSAPATAPNTPSAKPTTEEPPTCIHCHNTRSWLLNNQVKHCTKNADGHRFGNTFSDIWPHNELFTL